MLVNFQLPFQTLPALCNRRLTLWTTFPRIPCTLISCWVQPMGSTEGRLEGGTGERLGYFPHLPSCLTVIRTRAVFFS